jgi:hypothetical protein
LTRFEFCTLKPQGLKPANLEAHYAALKGRSSTVEPGTVEPGTVERAAVEPATL